MRLINLTAYYYLTIFILSSIFRLINNYLIYKGGEGVVSIPVQLTQISYYILFVSLGLALMDMLNRSELEKN